MDSITWAIVKMTLALGMMCVVLFFLVRVMKRNGGSKGGISSDSGIKMLTTQLIAPHKYISLVEIGDEVFVWGDQLGGQHFYT